MMRRDTCNNELWLRKRFGSSKLARLLEAHMLRCVGHVMSKQYAERISASTHSHTEQFLEVMKAYQHSIKDSKVKSLDLSGTHSWDQVMRLVKDTEVAYDEAGRSGLRQVGRFIGAQSESVVPYLKLIPNGFYTSTICGALKLVFELCSHIFWDMVVANIESRPLPISAGDVRKCWLHSFGFQNSFCRQSTRWKHSIPIQLCMTWPNSFIWPFSGRLREQWNG